MTIGDAIRAARKARGLTQTELAHAMGITGAAIGQYETGIRTPKHETVARIAHALSVPICSLVPDFAPEIKRLTDRCARYAEEIAVLQDVLCKFLRGRVDGDMLANIAEEIADVGIMLDQMAIEFEVEDAVAEQRAHKVRRLRERIEKDD